MGYKKKVVYLVLSMVFFALLGFLVSSKIFDNSPIGFAVVAGEFCDDGTQKGACSVSKPYFCDDALELVASCGVCSCPFGYNCGSDGGLCSGAGSCEAGGGACVDFCALGDIEFLPLTSTCNIAENRDGRISIGDSKKLSIEVTLKNLNSLASLSDISVNAYIVDTEVKSGFSLLLLDPDRELKQTIDLVMPQDLDLSKEYTLKIDIAFKDKKISAEYTSAVIGSGYVFVAKDTSITSGRLLPVGQDLLAGVEIVSKKCCIQNINSVKAQRFIDYCSSYGVCSTTTKPLYCEKGLLIENCQACGCQDGYTCSELGLCVSSVSVEEINKFYSQTQITTDESPLVGYSVKKFSRLAKEVEEPKVSIAPNLVNVQIADVDLEIKRENITLKPTIFIDINGV